MQPDLIVIMIYNIEEQSLNKAVTLEDDFIVKHGKGKEALYPLFRIRAGYQHSERQSR
jgi:hypothetical protein